MPTIVVIALTVCALMIVQQISLATVSRHMAWKRRILFYRSNMWIAWIVAIGFVVILNVVVGARGEDDSKSHWISAMSYAKSWSEQGHFLTSVAIAFVGAVIVVTLEVWLVRPFQHPRGIQRFVWLAWFLLAVVLAPVLSQAMTSLPEHKNNLWYWPPRKSADSANDVSSTTQTATTSRAITGESRFPRSVDPAFAAVVLAMLVNLGIGLAYWGWVSVGVFRQLSDVDHYKGRGARRIAGLRGALDFLKGPPHQAVFLGPVRSGKTSFFLFCLHATDHPDWRLCDGPLRRGTNAPVTCELAVRPLTKADSHISLSAIDTGGENLGDQLAILKESRVDRLVIVLSALHLKADASKANDLAWELGQIHDLFEKESESGRASSNYYAALHLATRMTTAGEGNQAASLPDVQSVLVLLNTGEAEGDAVERCEGVEIHSLLAFGNSLAERFYRGGARIPVAAWKVNLKPAGATNIGEPNRSFNIQHHNPHQCVGAEFELEKAPDAQAEGQG